VNESVFTPARPDCLHPEHWHSDDADSAEHEVTELVAAFVRAVQPQIVVETGTAWGATALAIGRALVRNGHGRLYTLEPDPHRADHSRRLCGNVPVTVVEKASLDWEPPDGVGFAWFDSLTHLRVAEFRAYASRLAAGAVVGFHDCGPQHGSLRASVEQLGEEGLLRPIYLPTPRGVIFAEATVA
jgi:hypothetical protein